MNQEKTNSGNLIIIRPSYVMKMGRYDEYYKQFSEQIRNGFIMLPPGFEVVVVPEDIEVIMMGFER